MKKGYRQQLPDRDPQETEEWIDSISSIIDIKGDERARYLLQTLIREARDRNIAIPLLTNSPYVNTIPPESEPDYPGDQALEKKIRRMIRWNAAMMVSKANKNFAGLGGHISTYASASSLYEVGFQHFFKGKDNGLGDFIYFQGHASPGIYSRAFIEGRLNEEQLDHFRRESFDDGLSSYPHPRLMPDFWEFPTVSMGLGPTNAIYHARFLRYAHERGICDTSNSRVWAFLGDGECDEPETLHALHLAHREKLDNLTFVINCNLQRLDGPVRGNGKIIQELEAIFRGSGWNVLKVLWGKDWDPLLQKDEMGHLLQKMESTVDGDYQNLAASSGDYIRQNFFGPEPELQKLVEDLDDNTLARLRRGGHDSTKLFAAYNEAINHKKQPTVILAKTVKGWSLGKAFEARNMTHQKKGLDKSDWQYFRDLLEIPFTDSELEDMPYYKPSADSPEIKYLIQQREKLGGFLPKRNSTYSGFKMPKKEVFAEFDKGTPKEQEVSTTMAFVRLLRNLMKDEKIGELIVPIVPDEARTFGMEALFTEFKIYTAQGQTYTPVDSKLLLSYKEAENGQILEEGISEAGAMSSFTAAGMAYSTIGKPTIPFYIYYSMFGFQRVGDQIWCAADSRARGFLLGATAGRTTLNGEGLQHQDGHSLLVADTVPSCISYDAAFAYEIGIIIKEGLRRMYDNNEDLLYYLTLYNENYQMPPKPKNCEEGIIKGIYKFKSVPKPKARLIGSGSIMQQVLSAHKKLKNLGIETEIWSATSFGGLRRDAMECERWNLLNPMKKAKIPYLSKIMGKNELVTIATTDHVKAVPDMIQKWMPGKYVCLGTDGFGRSDTRDNLRKFFEIDTEHIVAATISTLLTEGKLSEAKAKAALKTLDINPDTPDPARN
jgi:pyruvate dehydrogenase E1 component|tara:strand:- start:2900 stop:5560 length:2661 start_codon:yes stop_codon:yes gene_type:complete